MHCRKPEWRQALWHFTQHFHAKAADIDNRSDENTSNNDEQRDRLVLQKSFAQQQQDQRADTKQERRRICVTKMRKKVTRAFPEIAMRTFEGEKLLQPCARYKESDPALETNEDAFGNEVHDHTCPGQPRNKSKNAYDYRCA